MTANELADKLMQCGDGCPPRLEAAAMLRKQAAEIAGLAKAEKLYREGMESQAELMDGLKQENRQQTARIADLERELAAARYLLDLYADAPLKLDIAKQTIAVLKADAARMDWLCNNPSSWTFWLRGDGGLSGAYYFWPSQKLENIRSAIDAAMKKHLLVSEESRRLEREANS